MNSYDCHKPELIEKRDTDWFLIYPGSTREDQKLTLIENEDILDAINRNEAQLHKIEKLKLSEFSVGEFHPRIYRPWFPNYSVGWNIYDINAQISFEEQLAIFFSECENLFRTVQPDENNFHAFGHEIGNLLILICTELETQFRGILKANFATPLNGSTDRFNTGDFVQLLKPMRLSEYKIKLSNYPWLPWISPYDNWNNVKPTETLPWYKAYNLVKHDRWQNLSNANISNLLNALSACVIIYYAQYGKFPPPNGRIKFSQKPYPKWKLEEYYIPPRGSYHDPKNWKIKRYVF